MNSPPTVTHSDPFIGAMIPQSESDLDDQRKMEKRQALAKQEILRDKAFSMAMIPDNCQHAKEK